MKDRHHHDDPGSPVPQRQPVRFEFVHFSATNIAVAGTFNDWNPSTKALRAVGSGHWMKDTLLAPGTYEYCLVVDGQWLPDPSARLTVPNPFGGRNSVLIVADSPAAGHRADAATQPLKEATQPYAALP
jgi:1,4-alpha-glucan branching enzyme